MTNNEPVEEPVRQDRLKEDPEPYAAAHEVPSLRLPGGKGVLHGTGDSVRWETLGSCFFRGLGDRVHGSTVENAGLGGEVFRSTLGRSKGLFPDGRRHVPGLDDRNGYPPWQQLDAEGIGERFEGVF